MKRTKKGTYRELTDDSPIGRAVIATSVYRVRDMWDYRYLIPKRVARWPWQRSWQAEWDGCRRAVRAWTRHGALTKAVRAQLREDDR